MGVREVLDGVGVRSVFQPIVDLDDDTVVAYEALARGPVGEWERPDVLFAAARAEGCLAELDEACRRAAFAGAIRIGLTAPLTVFVNVEPEVLDRAPLGDLLAIAETSVEGLRVVLEITERALANRPAELLRTVERIRSFGWGVALDDVGADPLSLAFMPLLRPDIVKLDLRLVQGPVGPDVAEIMNAVNAYAQESGALILAEGIEDEVHLRLARGLGATLGQGWMFGRPASEATGDYPVAELPLPAATSGAEPGSPFACLPASTRLRRAPKALLIEVSKQLERDALRQGGSSVVAGTFQEARHFTLATAARYRRLVAEAGFVCALGLDLPAAPVPGVRGAALDPSDPVCGEWDLAVVGPHFAGALLARDLGDTGPDLERSFEYALSYDRQTVIAATRSILCRVAPQLRPAPGGVPPASADAPEDQVRADDGPAAWSPGRLEPQLERALAATPSGVTIADATRPDLPLIYVNAAFERMSGMAAEAVLGRNCRFLQSSNTDPAAVARIRAALDAGSECRERLLNIRSPDGAPWWNEIYLAPVRALDGTVVQYIGVQNDVTAQVETEQELSRERERADRYAAEIEQLAFTDPLTGVSNRRRLEERAEVALWDARTGGAGLALLFLDLDGFKGINDRLGHAAGDQLLRVVAERVRGRLRHADLVARLGGDEFLVVLTDLSPQSASRAAHEVAAQLARAVLEPIDLDGNRTTISASIGVSVFPADGLDFSALLRSADARMYEGKGPPIAGATSAPASGQGTQRSAQ